MLTPRNLLKGLTLLLLTATVAIFNSPNTLIAASLPLQLPEGLFWNQNEARVESVLQREHAKITSTKGDHLLEVWEIEKLPVPDVETSAFTFVGSLLREIELRYGKKNWEVEHFEAHMQKLKSEISQQLGYPIKDTDFNDPTSGVLRRNTEWRDSSTRVRLSYYSGLSKDQRLIRRITVYLSLINDEANVLNLHSSNEAGEAKNQKTQNVDGLSTMLLKKAAQGRVDSSSEEKNKRRAARAAFPWLFKKATSTSKTKAGKKSSTPRKPTSHNEARQEFLAEPVIELDADNSVEMPEPTFERKKRLNRAKNPGLLAKLFYRKKTAETLPVEAPCANCPIITGGQLQPCPYKGDACKKWQRAKKNFEEEIILVKEDEEAPLRPTPPKPIKAGQKRQIEIPWLMNLFSKKSSTSSRPRVSAGRGYFISKQYREFPAQPAVRQQKTAKKSWFSRLFQKQEIIEDIEEKNPNIFIDERTNTEYFIR